MTIAAAVLLLMAPPAAPAAPVAATGKWVMNYEPTLCTLSRQFGAGKEAVTFAVVKMPFAQRGDFLFQTPGRRPARAGAASLVMEPSGRTADVRMRTSPSADGKHQLTLLTVDADTLAALPASTGMRLEGEGLRVPAIALDKMPQAMAAMQKCEDNLIAALGVTPADRAAIATEAEPLSDERTWVTARDYPPDARRMRTQGETRIWWTIGADGRVADCHVILTSGDETLDKAACAALQRNARFTPAKNAAGQPVKDWGSQRVLWTMAPLAP